MNWLIWLTDSWLFISQREAPSRAQSTHTHTDITVSEYKLVSFIVWKKSCSSVSLAVVKLWLFFICPGPALSHYCTAIGSACNFCARWVLLTNLSNSSSCPMVYRPKQIVFLKQHVVLLANWWPYLKYELERVFWLFFNCNSTLRFYNGWICPII